MQAAVYEQFRGPIALVDVADPTPAADEVVVQVLAVGLCRSDYHGWHGTDPDIVCPHVAATSSSGASLPWARPSLPCGWAIASSHPS